MAMTLTIGTHTNSLRLVIHSVGLSCLGGAIFLQSLVFLTILQQGYFRAVETNPTILTLEVALTAFSAIYFIYLYLQTMRSNLKKSP
jgi:hypothetical protein